MSNCALRGKPRRICGRGTGAHRASEGAREKSATAPPRVESASRGGGKTCPKRAHPRRDARGCAQCRVMSMSTAFWRLWRSSLWIRHNVRVVHNRLSCLNRRLVLIGDLCAFSHFSFRRSCSAHLAFLRQLNRAPVSRRRALFLQPARLSSQRRGKPARVSASGAPSQRTRQPKRRPGARLNEVAASAGRSEAQASATRQTAHWPKRRRQKYLCASPPDGDSARRQRRGGTSDEGGGSSGAFLRPSDAQGGSFQRTRKSDKMPLWLNNFRS